MCAQHRETQHKQCCLSSQLSGFLSSKRSMRSAATPQASVRSPAPQRGMKSAMRVGCIMQYLGAVAAEEGHLQPDSLHWQRRRHARSTSNPGMWRRCRSLAGLFATHSIGMTLQGARQLLQPPHERAAN